MIKRNNKIVLTAFFVLIICLNSNAQMYPSGARARLRENINTLYLVRLTQVLELTQEQASIIYPAITRLGKEKEALHSNLSQHIHALRKVLGGGQIKEQDVLSLVTEANRLRKEIRQKDDEIEAVLDKNLNSIQKARYLLFSVDFYQRVNEAMNRARQASKPMTKRAQLP